MSGYDLSDVGERDVGVGESSNSDEEEEEPRPTPQWQWSTGRVIQSLTQRRRRNALFFQGEEANKKTAHGAFERGEGRRRSFSGKHHNEARKR